MAAAVLRNPRFPLLQNLKTPPTKTPFASLSRLTGDPNTSSGAPPPPPNRRDRAPSAETPRSPRLKSAIRSEPDPDRLVTLFESAAHNKRFHSERTLYALAVQKLIGSGRRDLIERLLDHSSSDPSAPKSDGFLARIITLYSSVGMLDQATSAFDRTFAAGRTVGELSLCALLVSFLKAGKLDSVVDTFNRATKQLNITAGVVSHNILLRALCRKGLVADARKVLDEMTKSDIVTYNTLLDGYLATKHVAGFDEILKEIDGKGLVRNVVTYNCCIAAFCWKKEVLKAEKMLDVMVAKDVLPNRESFKIIIEGFCLVGDMDAALRVFKKMKVMKTTNNRGYLAPDVSTYNMLIRGLTIKGEFGLALEICKECLSRKQVPPFELVKGLAVSLSANAKVDEAKDIVGKMRSLLKGGSLDAWKTVETQLSSSGVVIVQEN